MKYIAQTISYVLHPMLMPLYILFFIFNSNTLFAYIPWGGKTVLLSGDRIRSFDHARYQFAFV